MNTDSPVEVIATSISGSVKDWGKVDCILPLFREHGMEQVRLTVVDTHRAARMKACELNYSLEIRVGAFHFYWTSLF